MGKRSRRRGEPEEAVPASPDGDTPESDGATVVAAERGGALRRQLAVARRKRDEADALRDEQARRVGELERRMAAAERRADEAEQRVAERRATAERSAAEQAPEELSDEWLRAHEAALAELEQVRAHRDLLLRDNDALEVEAERQRQAIAELSAALGGTASDEAVPAPDAADEEPASVLEAVRI